MYEHLYPLYLAHTQTETRDQHDRGDNKRGQDDPGAAAQCVHTQGGAGAGQAMERRHRGSTVGRSLSLHRDLRGDGEQREAHPRQDGQPASGKFS